MTTITPQSHPKLFNACLLILQDCGGINRLTTAPTVIALPSEGDALVEAAEQGLRGLDEDEFCDFAIGEHDTALALAARSPELAAAHELLNIYFLTEIAATLSVTPAQVWLISDSTGPAPEDVRQDLVEKGIR